MVSVTIRIYIGNYYKDDIFRFCQLFTDCEKHNTNSVYLLVFNITKIVLFLIYYFSRRKKTWKNYVQFLLSLRV